MKILSHLVESLIVEDENIGTYRGYRVTHSGVSVSCPSLGLRGFRDEKALARAIDKKIGPTGHGSLPPEGGIDKLFGKK